MGKLHETERAISKCCIFALDLEILQVTRLA